MVQEDQLHLMAGQTLQLSAVCNKYHMLPAWWHGTKPDVKYLLPSKNTIDIPLNV